MLPADLPVDVQGRIHDALLLCMNFSLDSLWLRLCGLDRVWYPFSVLYIVTYFMLSAFL